MIYDIENGELEVTPEELSVMFLFRGWDYATPEFGFGPPTSEQIRNVFRDLVNEVMIDGRPSASGRLGRFLAIRHDNGTEDMSNSVDLYLNLGYVWALENEEDDSE